jgi:hypothetical protein
MIYSVPPPVVSLTTVRSPSRAFPSSLQTVRTEALRHGLCHECRRAVLVMPLDAAQRAVRTATRLHEPVGESALTRSLVSGPVAVEELHRVSHTNGARRKAWGVLVVEPEGNRQPGRPRQSDYLRSCMRGRPLRVWQPCSTVVLFAVNSKCKGRHETCRGGSALHTAGAVTRAPTEHTRVLPALLCACACILPTLLCACVCPPGTPLSMRVLPTLLCACACILQAFMGA